ncbi:RelA/SpoT domain-containing protein [Pseudoxanthomonas sp. PXM02]|uniref:RelA/SpoT domain-containing protein n=1 Tax=Pseudoxanthomonas sp. PXM02 TaxID=2769294 RepID=UPI00177AEB75|nr:RelA/SpoT domain-containing protein [Pseudoxanthomonas sp. PXM02]MBD9481164.1 RelA/SpoT domain-containing protein [Pseudoxanthomonas sp. PXM02]
MTFVKPCYAKPDVRRAGECLIARKATPEERAHATSVMTNWRASHGYVLNTFQSTLRNKLRYLDKTAIVGQRLKRAPSIVAKLSRFNTMKLHQMQDIAGLRAIVETNAKLKRLHDNYRDSRFIHELIKTHDYVSNPKPDGYRSIHLVYRYQNPKAPVYDGLFVELQLRTRLQHAWATAVETVDAFLGQKIKAGEPSQDWAEFFLLASAAFAHSEKMPLPEKFRNIAPKTLLSLLRKSEKKLDVLLKLRGFSVAADKIFRDGLASASYHLITLNSAARTLTISSFPLADQDLANKAYAELEERAFNGEPLDPVLVTGGRVDGLRKAYPNYFLDTQSFVKILERIINQGHGFE